MVKELIYIRYFPTCNPGSMPLGVYDKIINFRDKLLRSKESQCFTVFRSSIKIDPSHCGMQYTYYSTRDLMYHHIVDQIDCQIEGALNGGR